MPVAVSIEVQGLQMLQRVMEAKVRALQGEPMLRGMRNATLMVERHAKINSPVDTGRLRASITPEVGVGEGNAVEGIVGSNVEYAPYQEFGTKHMRGQHYLEAAFYQSEDYIHKAIGEVVFEVMWEGLNQ